jgi:hypothetical protein
MESGASIGGHAGLLRAQAPAFNSRRPWRSVESAGQMASNQRLGEGGGQLENAAGRYKLRRFAREERMTHHRAATRRDVAGGLLAGVVVGGSLVVPVSGSVLMGHRAVAVVVKNDAKAMALMRSRIRRRYREDRDQHCKA